MPFVERDFFRAYRFVSCCTCLNTDVRMICISISPQTNHPFVGTGLCTGIPLAYTPGIFPVCCSRTLVYPKTNGKVVSSGVKQVIVRYLNIIVYPVATNCPIDFAIGIPCCTIDQHSVQIVTAAIGYCCPTCIV